MSVLAFAEVAFRYPGAAAPAVDGLSFTVAPGEGVALLGPNGAGKTTVTRLAAALRHPDGGRVLTAGRDTRGRRPEDLAEAVGYLFQHPEVQLFRRTVRAELAFGPEQLGWPADRIAARVTEVLGALGLDSHADAHPYDLPGPARRLVALGAATMLAPPLLVLDEPSAGLDRATRARLERLIREHRARGGAVLAVMLAEDLTNGEPFS